VWGHPRRRDETGRHPRASRQAGPRRRHVRWLPTHGSPQEQPSDFTGLALPMDTITKRTSIGSPRDENFDARS
jgi:hypothetical protein